MSKTLRALFAVHAVVATLVGVVMWLIPGRFLVWLGWAPIDPILSRLLGAALLALAWGSFRGWRAALPDQVVLLVEADAVFTLLGCVALLRHLLVAHYPLMVWLLLAVLALFAAGWVWALLKPLRRG